MFQGWVRGNKTLGDIGMYKINKKEKEEKQNQLKHSTRGPLLTGVHILFSCIRFSPIKDGLRGSPISEKVLLDCVKSEMSDDMKECGKSQFDTAKASTPNHAKHNPCFNNVEKSQSPSFRCFSEIMNIMDFSEI